MINHIGKGLAVVHVGLSIVLMAFAGALYAGAVDFGWKEPRRFFRDPPNKSKDENLLIASDLDKAQATVNKLLWFKSEELYNLGQAQQRLARVEPWLGKNHVRGMDILDNLDHGPGTFEIDDLQYNDKGRLVLDKDAPRGLGFPELGPPQVKREYNINKSYATYLAELRKLEGEIDKVQTDIVDIEKKQEKITERLIGDTLPDGKPNRHKDGSIVLPGWYYLLEVEKEAHRQLQKELDYLQPLWVQELVNAQLLVGRRDLLLQRLQELGAKGYMSQSEFQKKQLQQQK
jgi:hypothetical protein